MRRTSCVIERSCECGAAIQAETLEAFSDAFLRHVRGDHADWPYPDFAVRNVGEALARLTGSTERLAEIGPIEVHPVTPDRVDDWLSFFDHDAFAGRPVIAMCYCLEPHLRNDAIQPWRERRAAMVALFGVGAAFGYLGYVDGRPGGWVNAAMRGFQLARRGDDAEPPDRHVVAITCFNIAPPYRGHGLAAALLDRVIADAASRGARWVEAYPLNDGHGVEVVNFRGPRSLYDSRGFEVVKVRQRDTVVRRAT